MHRACSKPPTKSRASVADLQYPIGDAVERFRFGVALHVGRILYGNIGGGNRLDFTCIGPAVNLAARLEKIASQLSRTVVASEGFAGICSGGWSDLGEFPVAGFSKAARVYGLAGRDTGPGLVRASFRLRGFKGQVRTPLAAADVGLLQAPRSGSSNVTHSRSSAKLKMNTKIDQVLDQLDGPSSVW